LRYSLISAPATIDILAKEGLAEPLSTPADGGFAASWFSTCVSLGGWFSFTIASPVSGSVGRVLLADLGISFDSARLGASFDARAPPSVLGRMGIGR
jgi:hypothetical protein